MVIDNHLLMCFVGGHLVIDDHLFISLSWRSFGYQLSSFDEPGWNSNGNRYLLSMSID